MHALLATVVPPGHQLVFWTSRTFPTEQIARIEAYIRERVPGAAFVCGIEGVVARPKE